MEQFPIARQKDLIVEELSDEVLVYDVTTDKAHCLNRTSALIWKNCDGEKSEREISRLLEQEFKSPVPVELVSLGLDELAAHGLLQPEISMVPKAQVSRRRLIQNLGLTAAVAVPLIMSLSVPAAAGASSTTDPCIANPRAEGCPCNQDGDCDSGNCNVGICGPPLRPSRHN
jgi:hypothetical protein